MSEKMTQYNHLEKCRTCKFAVPDFGKHGMDTFRCHGGPPIMMIFPITGPNGQPGRTKDGDMACARRTEFPVVAGGDWCGAYRPKVVS